MRKRIAFTIVTACALLITGCGASNSAENLAGTDNQVKVTYVENGEQADTEENIATDGVADYPAAIMVNDTVYLIEGDPMPAEVDESAIIGYTESYTGTFPENNGETNFNPELGMPYAQVEGGIAVLYKNKWYLGTPFSNENTITFTGIIIDHTVESLVPVICVKTLDEEVIPYEAVFFELPEGEEDWALKIGEVVLITCSGGFTEPAPHYGTLISIRNADTDVLSPLDGVTMEVTECSDTSVTIKITNDTDKDIECGSDFCLKMQDEETREWRELDEVIDNAAFTSEAYMIQKDSPYEKVIDFEWLYGKLEPGRYRIVKTITDFRGTGDYTDYAYMAEFSIEEDSDIVNAEELADTFGILISLPENTTWITDSEYYLVDENNLRISYHDLITDTDCTLLVSKNNNLNLPQAEYDETLNETWEGFTIGRQHIVVKVQHENNDEKMVLATWEYNEYQFAIISENVNDSTPIPKVALYIIGKLD